jgi:hypothetical protein
MHKLFVGWCVVQEDLPMSGMAECDLWIVFFCVCSSFGRTYRYFSDIPQQILLAICSGK